MFQVSRFEKVVNKQGVAWTVSEGHLFSNITDRGNGLFIDSVRTGTAVQEWNLCFVLNSNEQVIPFLVESQIVIGHEHEAETLYKHSAFKKIPLWQP